MNFLENLKDPDVGPWVINFLLFLLMVSLIVFYEIKKKRKEKKKEEQKKSPEKVEDSSTKKPVKPKRSWSFNPFGWFKTTPKKDLWDKILIRIIVPGILIVGGWLVYTGEINFSGGEIIWLIIIGLALIIFATRSRWFRILTMWGGSFALIGLGIFWLTTLNLWGTPWPVQVAPVSVKFDVSEPRWTQMSIFVPNNCMLEISADGIYSWNSGGTEIPSIPCDPNGVRYPGGKLVLANMITNPKQFMLVDEPFAGLIGKVDEDGESFFIGKRCKKHIKKGGFLYLGINIRWVRTGSMNGYTGPDSWKKNWMNARGVIDVNVTIKPRSG